MSAARVVLLRHGRTAWNQTGRLQGHSDVPLDEVGREQARAAAWELAGLEPALIVSSDLMRAADTAGALAEASGAEVRIDARLRERNFGAWEGLTGAEIEAGWPAEFAAWRRGEEPGGIAAEPRADVARRVTAAITEAAAQLDAEDVLVVVAHGGALSSAMTVLLGETAGEWFGVYAMENGRWSVLEANPRGVPAWRLRRHDVGPSQVAD